MCGIALFFKNQDVNKIKSIITYLEKERGMDGVGIGWFEDGRPHTEKRLFNDWGSNDKIVEYIQGLFDRNVEMVMYHTRKATHGYIDEQNIHPFILDANVMFCHNGVWRDSDDFSKTMLLTGDLTLEEYGSYSDTRILQKLMQKLGMKFMDYAVDSGVYLFMYDGFAVLRKKTGSFEVLDDEDVSYYASVITEAGAKEFDNATCAIITTQGCELKYGEIKEKVAITTHFHSYDMDDWEYDYDGTGDWNYYLGYKNPRNNFKHGYKIRKDNVFLIFNKEHLFVAAVNENGQEVPFKRTDIPLIYQRKNRMQLSKKDIRRFINKKDEKTYLSDDQLGIYNDLMETLSATTPHEERMRISNLIIEKVKSGYTKEQIGFVIKYRGYDRYMK